MEDVHDADEGTEHHDQNGQAHNQPFFVPAVLVGSEGGQKGGTHGQSVDDGHQSVDCDDLPKLWKQLDCGEAQRYGGNDGGDGTAEDGDTDGTDGMLGLPLTKLWTLPRNDDDVTVWNLMTWYQLPRIWNVFGSRQ